MKKIISFKYMTSWFVSLIKVSFSCVSLWQLSGKSWMANNSRERSLQFVGKMRLSREKENKVTLITKK